MRIQSNSEMGKQFAERILSEHYNRTSIGRKGWHRSDAISCPLKAYWRITGEVQGEYRSRDVGIVMIGEMGHQVLERGFDAQEKVYNIAGVQVTIDALHGEFPVEIKTTRKQIYTKDAIPKDWVEQLAIGMSVMNVEKGYLMIINIINVALTVFEFDMSDQERELTRNAFIWQIMNVAEAVEKRNPAQLKPRYEDCFWCVYRPSRANINCPYYKKVEKTD
jgi:CRISPR/Cas system-associated exonuclease Cas4 (RecB family)